MGDGPERKNLQNFIKKNTLQKNVLLVGSVERADMANYYKVADIVLVPSISVKGYKEATSLSVLEAMAAKVPVIASNIGGLTEIVTHEVTGLLIPEKSGKDIAEGILRLFDDQGMRNMVVNSAFDYVTKNHSHRAAAQKIIRLYNEARR